MNLIIDPTHSLTPSRWGWTLTHAGGTPSAAGGKRQDFHTLSNAGQALIALNLITKEQAQAGWALSAVAGNTEAEIAMTLTKHPASTSYTVNLGEGMTIKRRGDEWTVTRGRTVSKPPSLFFALREAVDIAFKAAEGSIPYTETNATLYRVAKNLFAGVTLTFNDAQPGCDCGGKCSGHLMVTRYLTNLFSTPGTLTGPQPLPA